MQVEGLLAGFNGAKLDDIRPLIKPDEPFRHEIITESRAVGGTAPLSEFCQQKLNREHHRGVD